MKLLKIMAVAVMLICITLACVSCKKNKEDAPVEGQTTERFDYFAVENYSEYVSIDKSVYENVKIELEDKFTVDDKQVEEYIDYLLFQKKTVKNNGAKITGEAIKRGDTAYIFYRGVMLDANGEEKEFEGGSNMSDASPHALSIGSGSFIDGFEDGLIGIVPSATSPENMIKLDLKFPSDYGSAELAGKDVTFYVYVSWIVQYELPEYNEKFITETMKFTATTQDVVTEHKLYLKNALEKSFADSKSQEIEAAIWEELYEKAEILKYPDSEVEYFYNAYYKDVEEAMTYYNYTGGYGFTDVAVFARWYLGLDENGDWQSVLKEQARLAVKQTLIYHAVAQQCGITVSDADFEAVITEAIENAKQAGKEYSREEIIAQLGEAAIREGELYEKVVAYIKERATITYKPVEEK